MDRHELACMNRHASMLLLLRACMRAFAATCVLDTMYQLIYTSAQTRAWRIEFSYKYIRDYWERLKGRVRGNVPQTRPFDRSQ
jgi:hypothetical protein